MERTIRHFALNYDNARVEKIYVSSGIQPHPRILDYIGEELGLPIEEFNPFAPAEGFNCLPGPPESASEKGSYAPALGMALASNATTPNFLYTHKNRNRDSSTRRINRGVFACFFVLILACVGLAFWQEQQIKEKELQKQELLTIASSKEAEQPFHYSAGRYVSRFLEEMQKRKRFVGIRCSKCGKVYVPPREVCGPCFAKMEEEVEVGPRATLRTYTIIRFPYIDPERREIRSSDRR